MLKLLASYKHSEIERLTMKFWPVVVLPDLLLLTVELKCSSLEFLMFILKSSGAF